MNVSFLPVKTRAYTISETTPYVSSSCVRQLRMTSHRDDPFESFAISFFAGSGPQSLFLLTGIYLTHKEGA